MTGTLILDHLELPWLLETVVEDGADQLHRTGMAMVEEEGEEAEDTEVKVATEVNLKVTEEDNHLLTEEVLEMATVHGKMESMFRE